MKIATLHLKYKEYSQAEDAIQKVLADADVSATPEALELLDSIKAAKAADAIPDAASNAPVPSVEPNPANVSAPDNSPNLERKSAAPAIVAENSVKRDIPSVSTESPSPAPKPVPLPANSTAKSDGKSAEILIVHDKVAEGVASERVAATEAMIAKLESRLKDESEAAEALRVYERFVERHSMTAEQEQKFSPRVAKWKEVVANQLVRWGNQWMTPEAAAEKKAKSGSLIEQADAMMKQRNFKEAATLLERASNFDPNSIRADFTLGLMYSGVGLNQPAEAGEHFKKVLLRTPGHIAALNNLALIEIKLERFPQAFNRFTQAAELAPRAPEVTHNVGRVIREAGLKKLDVPAPMLSAFNKLYSDLTQIGQAKPSNPNVGWRYMPMYLPERERPPGASSEAIRADQGDHLVLYGSGTGFFVSPGYVLTNRAVVRDDRFGMAEVIRVRDPADPAQLRELPASVVAISADHDLALVKCGQVQSSVLSLSSAIPDSGAEIAVLGFPTSALANRKLRDARASIAERPEASNGNHLIIVAELNGLSGGPILSKTGEAVGLISSGYKITGSRKSVAAIPSSVAMSFVKVALPDFASETVRATEADWADVITRAAPAAVALLCYRREVIGGANPERLERRADGRLQAFEDTLCSMCNGSGFLPCKNKGCYKGSISRKETYSEVVGLSGNTRTINKVRFVNEECPVCDGKARVDCRACDRGRDPSLKGR